MIRLHEARSPTSHEIYWISCANELIKDSPKRIDDEAKNLVTLGSSLIAMYLALLTFIKIPNFLELFFYQKIIIFLAPICFLISIGFNLYVHFPERHQISSKYPEVTRIELKKSVENKYNKLKIGSIIFFIALIFLIIGVYYMINLNPQFQPQEVQFIVPKEQWQTFQDMSIGMENGSQKTKRVILLNSTEKTYEVLLDSGRRLAFKSDLVIGILYK